jgi:DNA-binding NarL/FixJ family response regulator
MEGSRWALAQAVSCGFGSSPDHVAAVVRLRPRELQVLRMANEGLGDAEIAKRLVVSRRTVGNHLASANRELGVHSRTAARHTARQRGLLAS